MRWGADGWGLFSLCLGLAVIMAGFGIFVGAVGIALANGAFE